MRKFNFTLSLLLVLFLICSCSTLSSNTGSSSASSSFATSSKTITVSGTGSVNLKADNVSFRIEISETEETTALAQQATNKKMSQLLEILRENGIQDSDISTTALNFSTDYIWESGRQTKVGETVSQTVYVRMYNLDGFAALADAIGSNISGISFYNVTFGSTQSKEAENQARQLAYTDALKKAQTYATAAGVTLGQPITIQDGGSSTYSNKMSSDAVLFTAAATESATYDTETPTGPLTVSASVDVVFEIK